MNHGRGDKAHFRRAEIKRLAVFYSNHLTAEIDILEEIGDHLRGLGCGYNLGLRIKLHKTAYTSRMVGLNMLNDEIIGLAACQRELQSLKPLVETAVVNSVDYRNARIIDQI